MLRLFRLSIYILEAANRGCVSSSSFSLTGNDYRKLGGRKRGKRAAATSEAARVGEREEVIKERDDAFISGERVEKRSKGREGEG